MDKFLTFGIVGLNLAAIYAVMASGLVVTYATTGIFNFAHGATGMLAAFAYWQLRIQWGWPAPLALFVVLFVLAPLFGWFLDWLVMRRIRDLSEAVKIVATIALLTGMIAVARWVWNPNKPRSLSKFFQSSASINVGPTTVTWHQLITIAVAIAVAVGLRFLLFRTRIGLAMRASVDDSSLAVLNGARPAFSAKLAWSLGSCLAAVGGILIAPLVTLDPATLSLLIVSAYAAAVFGRLRSLPLAFVGAVIVGCTEAYMAGYLPRNQYLPGLRLASPALILFIALLVMPHHRLRTRVRSRESFPVPGWRNTLIFVGIIVFSALVLGTTLSSSDALSYGRIFSFGLIALSLVPLAGYSGQISLCQLSLAGIGGLAYAHLGNGGPLGLVWAMLIPAAIGVLVALPALRLSGIYLALSTAAFALVLDKWLFTIPTFSVFGWFDVTLFEQGSLEVPPLHLFGATLNKPGQQMVMAAVLLSVAMLAVVALRRGFFGRRLIALRDSEAACATLGGNLVVAKVAVFAISAAIAGLGGAVYSIQGGTISANFFEFVTGLTIFVLAVVGGIAKVGGAFFAGVALAGSLPALVQTIPSLENLTLLAPGLAGIGLGANPNGVTGQMSESWGDLRRTRWAAFGLALFIVGWYALRMTHVIDNWTFVIGFVVGVAAIRISLRVVEGRKASADRVPTVPLELRGVTVPWTPADLVEIDRGLALATGQRR
jgi:branched-chain amino acid transport system permease protein